MTITVTRVENHVRQAVLITILSLSSCGGACTLLFWYEVVYYLMQIDLLCLQKRISAVVSLQEYCVPKWIFKRVSLQFYEYIRCQCLICIRKRMVLFCSGKVGKSYLSARGMWGWGGVGEFPYACMSLVWASLHDIKANGPILFGHSTNSTQTLVQCQSYPKSSQSMPHKHIPLSNIPSK